METPHTMSHDDLRNKVIREGVDPDVVDDAIRAFVNIGAFDVSVGDDGKVYYTTVEAARKVTDP